MRINFRTSCPESQNNLHHRKIDYILDEHRNIATFHLLPIPQMSTTYRKVLYCGTSGPAKIIKKTAKLRDWCLVDAPDTSGAHSAPNQDVIFWPDQYMLGLGDYMLILEYDPIVTKSKYLKLPVNSALKKFLGGANIKTLADFNDNSFSENDKWRGDCYIIKMLPDDDADEIISDYNHNEFIIELYTRLIKLRVANDNLE